VVRLAGWTTASATDGERAGTITRDMTGSSLTQQAQLVASGPMPTGSPAGTGKPGQLNPAHSRWLMGYPPEWDDCAVMGTQLCQRAPKRSSKPSSKLDVFA
jgi:hypothetical protein